MQDSIDYAYRELMTAEEQKRFREGVTERRKQRRRAEMFTFAGMLIAGVAVILAVAAIMGG